MLPKLLGIRLTVDNRRTGLTVLTAVQSALPRAYLVKQDLLSTYQNLRTEARTGSAKACSLGFQADRRRKTHTEKQENPARGPEGEGSWGGPVCLRHLTGEVWRCLTLPLR